MSASEANESILKRAVPEGVRFRRWLRTQVWVTDIDDSRMPAAVRKTHQYHHQHQKWDRLELKRARTKTRRRMMQRRILGHQRTLDALHARYGVAPSTPGTPGNHTPPVVRFEDNPSAPVATHTFFQHGVATGDPMADRVIIWTRLTPTPDATPGSGAGPAATVYWQVASEATFTHLVAQGMAATSAAKDHTVKVDVTGLVPSTGYFVRFAWQGPWQSWQHSPVARTRTAPAVDGYPDNLRLGMVSCANLQAGWFTSYRALAAREDLDAILHLGDYIYEYGPGEYGMGQANVDVRRHEPPHEIITLADYRQRHAQYKKDADLAKLHLRYPFITTWDDHESADDSWKDGAVNQNEPQDGSWATRKAVAKQAYDEWMPIRLRGTEQTVYRRLTFGNLAELTLLDLRTYRDEQAGMESADVDNPDRTLTGDAQMEFLKAGLTPDAPQWRLVGNPVMITPVHFGELPGETAAALGGLGGTGVVPTGVPYNTDQWDGYTADRKELFNHIADQGVRDVVFLTGDIHTGWACDLPYDPSSYRAGLGGSAGVEFVGASISSNNFKDITGTPAGTTSVAAQEGLKQVNPHIKWVDLDSHGFSIVDITPARVQVDWFVISRRDDPNATVRWSTSWRTKAGTSTVESVGSPVA